MQEYENLLRESFEYVEGMDPSRAKVIRTVKSLNIQCHIFLL